MLKKRAVCIISGGMDSALAAQIAKNDNYDIIAVHFNYGQRTQRKELECFKKIVTNLNATAQHIIDLDFFAQIGVNALTDNSIDVPTKGIKPGVPITYVPFRNGIFLSIASALVQKYSAEAIFIGVVEEDSSGYPDCRESFIKSMENSINLGLNDNKVEIKTPLIHLSKADIVKKSLELGVKLENTWSCYKNEDLACGLCDSCRLRLNGFKQLGLKDPINYEIVIK